MEAVAEFDFDGRADDEISFQIGTLLLVSAFNYSNFGLKYCGLKYYSLKYCDL